MARWLPYDHFAMYLFIGGVTMLGVIAMQVSPHGLAWLFLCITSILVLLESLTNPLQAASVAYYRMFEVGIGVLSAIIVANLLQDWHREPAPTAPGWRHLLDAQWSVVLHGARSAIAVCAVLAIWMALEVSQVVEMAITVAVVMAAPGWSPTAGSATRHAIAVRSLHRFLGCLLGGVVALICLALDVKSFVWWLAMIGGAVWIGMHIQVGPHGVGYVGTQAAFVFIVTLIQGEGAALPASCPASSASPASSAALPSCWSSRWCCGRPTRSSRSRRPRSRNEAAWNEPDPAGHPRHPRLGDVLLGAQRHVQDVEPVLSRSSKSSGRATSSPSC